MEGASGAKVGGEGGGADLSVWVGVWQGGGGLSRISRQNMKSEKCHVAQSRWTLSEGGVSEGVIAASFGVFEEQMSDQSKDINNRAERINWMHFHSHTVLSHADSVENKPL